MAILAPDDADLAALDEFERRLEHAPVDPRATWRRTARPEQLLPAEAGWRVCYWQGGRGAGKNASCSNAMADWVLSDTDGEGEYGIIGPTYADAWTKCVEGKALDLDTYVPTPDGATTMGALQAGDRVIGGDGNPCTVTGTYRVMTGHDCYRVTFKGGAQVVADADHLWLVETYRDRYYNRHYKGGRAPVVMTTRDMIPSVRYAGMRGRTRNYGIAVAKTSYSDQQSALPVDPYALGYWLGDGISKSGAITTADPEVLTHYAGAGYQITDWADTRAGQASTYGILGLYRDLRLAGVLRNKHVPVQYLRAPAADRLAIVQGLMDSDGYVSERGQCEFGSKLPHLADALVELLCSLGIKASAPRGKVVNGTTYWLVKFTTTEPVFRLQRKLDRLPASYRDADYWLIESIEPVESVPVRCISVDSPDRTYMVTRHHIATHNTGILRALGTSMAEIKDHRSRTVKAAWRTYGQVVLQNGIIIYVDSAAEGGLRVQGRNLKGAWCIAAGELVATRNGPVPIEHVQPGDMVATRRGWRRVTAQTLTRCDAEVVRLTAEDGCTVRLTADHRVWTVNRGWRMASDLTPYDTIVLWNPTLTNSNSDRPLTSSGTAASPIRPGSRIIPGTAPYAAESKPGWQSGSLTRCPEPDGTADVYDLTVEGAHEFFAGGILVHNCSEIGLWDKWEMAWKESVNFAVRDGRSQIIADGTPKASRKARKLIRSLIRNDPEHGGVIIRKLRTRDNIANLSAAFVRAVVGGFRGTRLEMQELEGELLDDVANALWTRDLLDSIKVPGVGQRGGPALLLKTYIGVDPSDGSEDSDEQAYTVVGKGRPDDHHIYVAENWGGQESPAPFAKRVIRKAVEWNATVVVEKNHGGKWLAEVFRQAQKDMGTSVRVETVHASDSKRVRAEPVAVMYDRYSDDGRPLVLHCHRTWKDDDGHVQVDEHMPELEDCMATYTGAAGEKSPDRLDSLCWAASKFLRESFDLPGTAGVCKWAGSAEMEAAGPGEETRAARKMREITDRGRAPEAAPWDLDGFAPGDDREELATGRRGNVRAWR